MPYCNTQTAIIACAFYLIVHNILDGTCLIENTDHCYRMNLIAVQILLSSRLKMETLLFDHFILPTWKHRLTKEKPEQFHTIY